MNAIAEQMGWAVVSGMPTYESLEVTIEKIVAMKASTWSFPGMDPDDIAQEVRLLCFQALQKYDPAKEGKGAFYFLAKCVDNGLFNKGRGIYFDNNPPCTRCPDYDRKNKICCGSQRKIDYDIRMARRRAIDNPTSLYGNVANDDFDSSPFGRETAIGSTTGVVDLDEHIKEVLEPHLVQDYEAMASGDPSEVSMAAKREIREVVRRVMEEN